ncbi:MAG: Ig-like domain-containing protein, partial [Planctomycetes bacterium]|nr:Ig-like domain-containing protein [Planctomycetota bacterium]
MKAFLACALVLALGACDALDTEVAKTAASQSAASQGTATQSVTTQSVTTQIINWELVERERIDRTTVEFTYRADLQNAGPDMTGATAFALRAGTGTTLVEPTLRFARIGNGALVTSSDTFTIRHDREVAFDPDAVDWLVLSYGPETLVARERFDRDHVDFTYQAWLDNLGDSPTDLRARAYSTQPALEILDPIIEADSLAPEQRSRSVDTFEIRQDRNFPFDPDSLRFELTAGDSTAPSIELAAPSAVQAGQPIQATATVSDDVGVSEVAFVVDGLLVTTLSAPPYVLFYNAPPNPGAVVEIRAQARDAAGNEGNALALVTVVAGDDPDTVPPVIDAVHAPPTVAPGETFQASALASDDRGIAEVCFAFTGPVPVCDDAPPYQVSLQVPGDAVAGTSLTIQATARDLSDNAASASVDTQVVVAPDNQPPTGVVISAPEEAYPGEPVELRAVAIDDVGILDIRFLADDVQLARDEEIPYAAFVTIPADLPAGSQIRWTAVASDFAGGSTESDPAITTIVARADGFVVGEVYDAYSGLALPGALAQFVGASEVTPDVAVPASSDSLGRYLLPSAEGDARLEITAPGYTSAFRPIAVPAGGVA